MGWDGGVFWVWGVDMVRVDMSIRGGGWEVFMWGVALTVGGE